MGRVTHFEIHAVDPAAMARFYSEVLGWKFQRWDGPIEYWLIETGDAARPGINGGLFAREGGPPADGQAVNAYVCMAEVESVDDTVAKGLAAGGSVALPKHPIPGIGWLAYLKDLDGTIFGVMQPDPKAA